MKTTPQTTLTLVSIMTKSKATLTTAMILVASAISANADVLYSVQFGGQASETNVYDASLVTVTTDGVTGSSAADFAANETVDQVFANDRPDGGLITGGQLRFQHNGVGVGDDITAGQFADGFFVFNITALSGETLDLTNLTFDAIRATGGDTVRGIEVFAETNGDAFAFATSTQLLDVNITPNRTGPAEAFDLDLSGGEFQGINSVDFRVYATGGRGSIELGNIALNGVAVIPEPSSAALLVGLFAVAFVSRRRR
jgi:hypothetical protein